MKVNPRNSSPGMLTPLATAAGIAGVPAPDILDWMAAGRVRSERINKRVYVSLDDVLASVGEPRGGIPHA